MFENRVLGILLWLKGKGDNRRLGRCIAKDSWLVFLTNIIRLRWADRVARMEEKRSAHRDIVAKSLRKRSLGRPRLSCEDNIKNIF